MPWQFESLAFESGVFGVPVGRLVSGAQGLPLDNDQAIEFALVEAGLKGCWLISCRVPEGDSAAARDLESKGFRPVETLVTLRRSLDPAVAAPADVGPATAPEHAETVAIARGGFTYDRFHADPQVPKPLADRLKAQWVENGLKGRSDLGLLARADGAVQGFILCMRAGVEAVIDLIAVAPAHRGKGVGRRLVAGALAHYAGRARAMRVGTQAANAPSIRLYESMGFAVQSRHVTFHWTNPTIRPRS